ncbi:MAG: Gfo/Idh/MocA family oxidoreductase [Caldilineaceae bacterium]|nr:Gfo/Idh/MocA family oxidoreductase [Caldilineaceae bacterium]
MSDKIRIGIVGTSWYSGFLLSCLATCPEAEIAAVCGRTRSRAEELAAKHPGAVVYTDYNEMIAKGRLDGVIVASPDDLHYPMVMAALKAKLHVLCEKPMALTVAHAQQMREAAEEAGVKHLMEFTVRWMPHSRYLHQLVQEGYFGRASHYTFHHYGDRAFNNDYDWHWDAARSLGVLGDLGSHTIALALWLGGEIRSVSAHLATFSQRLNPAGQPLVGANESAQLILDFADGAHGTIQLNQRVHMGERGRDYHAEVNGEAGRAEVDWWWGTPKRWGKVEMRGVCKGETEFQSLPIPDEILQGVDPSDIFGIFQNHLVGPRLFVDAILRDYQPEPGFDVGVKVQKVLNAALESHQTGQRMYIDG